MPLLCSLNITRDGVFLKYHLYLHRLLLPGKKLPPSAAGNEVGMENQGSVIGWPGDREMYGGGMAEMSRLCQSIGHGRACACCLFEREKRKPIVGGEEGGEK